METVFSWIERLVDILRKSPTVSIMAFLVFVAAWSFNSYKEEVGMGRSAVDKRDSLANGISDKLINAQERVMNLQDTVKTKNVEIQTLKEALSKLHQKDTP